MAQIFTSGPCPIYVGGGASATPLFLGHAEKFPRIALRPRFSDVFCDLSGQSVAYDVSYDGEDATVTADIVRWNEAAYTIIADRAKTNTAAATNRGTNGFGEIGTMMMTEGVGYPLYLIFPFTAKPAYASQPRGYRFWCSFLQGPDDFELGSTARKLRLSWRCIRQIRPASGATTAVGADNFGGALQVTLYDNDVSACNGVPVL
jgi:hypothetical protein